MGDMIFFVPPVLESLKKTFPDCHITMVTAWGFKNKKGQWGKRNQDGFCIALLMHDPHIDQLVHWHDTDLSLDATICQEAEMSFSTWNKSYYEKQKTSGTYDGVYELDFGMGIYDNPMERIYQTIGLPEETNTNYRFYATDAEKEVASLVMASYPQPRIFLLEGLEGQTSRGWDPGKIPDLENQLSKKYDVTPLWFGGRHVRFYKGRPLTLRENIACLLYGSIGIGVLSGPLHFAAAIGLPTVTLYADHPIHRAAPAYFLNPYISETLKKHRTLVGPTSQEYKILKNEVVPEALTPKEVRHQYFIDWLRPGKQATKTGLAAITVDEVMTVVEDMLPASINV